MARFGALYTVAVSCVLVWRGTWLGWDVVYEYFYPHAKSTDRGHATHSGLASHTTAVGLLLATGLFASVLAPPAAVSVIRDFAVKTGASSSGYMGPAQVVANRLFGGASGGAASQRTLSTVARTYKSYKPTSTSTSTSASTVASQRRTK
jgi:hypothetical protein